MDRRQEELTTLGFLGLTPMVAGAVVVWISPFVLPKWAALNIHSVVLTYAGVIAGFMAGMSAAASLLSPRGFASLLAPMIAALVAWLAVLPGGFLTFSTPAAWRYLIVILVFGYLLMRDLGASARGDFPSWYGALRVRLTFWASLSLALIALRLAYWGHA